MVKYAFYNSDNVIVCILDFDSNPDNIELLVSDLNAAYNNEIYGYILVDESQKFYGVGMDLIDGKIIPKKPYNSWVWDDILEEWTSPVPHPNLIDTEDENWYVWDENSLTWIIQQ